MARQAEDELLKRAVERQPIRTRRFVNSKVANLHSSAPVILLDKPVPGKLHRDQHQILGVRAQVRGRALGDLARGHDPREPVACRVHALDTAVEFAVVRMTLETNERGPELVAPFLPKGERLAVHAASTHQPRSETARRWSQVYQRFQDRRLAADVSRRGAPLARKWRARAQDSEGPRKNARAQTSKSRRRDWRRVLVASSQFFLRGAPRRLAAIGPR